MRGRVQLVLTAALLASTVAAAPGSARRSVEAHGGAFFSNCKFSHTGPDDPIVYPRQPGNSHPHTFFGNRSTDANSTLASLRAAATTCAPRADTAAYWVPTLYLGGREIRPSKVQAYYVMKAVKTMRAFPPGLRIIAGDAHARHAQSTQVTYWSCGAPAFHTAPSERVPTCSTVSTPFGAAKTFLELNVIFPDCWDGRHLDSPDHQSHMAYSRNRVCGASHPVKVPRLRLIIRYPIQGGPAVSLASGGQLTGHGDFFNAWNQRFLARLVNSCFHQRGCDPEAPL